MNNLIRTSFRNFVLLCLTSFMLVGCGLTEEEIEEYMQMYGYEKAFITLGTDSNGNTIYFHAPSSVSYYIDSTVTGNYLTAVNYGIPLANELTDAVTIDKNGDSNSPFLIKVENQGANGQAASNSRAYNAETGERTGGVITLNSYYMQSYSLDQLRSVVLHELGHTFGLIDLYDDILADYSVMYYIAGSFTEYQEYDKRNIAWYYG